MQRRPAFSLPDDNVFRFASLSAWRLHVLSKPPDDAHADQEVCVLEERPKHRTQSGVRADAHGPVPVRLVEIKARALYTTSLRLSIAR